MTALAIGAFGIVDDWLGDIVALLWEVVAFLTPWLLGIALGPRALGTQGRVIGALTGALIVVVPTLIYVLAQPSVAAEQDIPLLLAFFVPLSLAQGAIAMPVGGTVLRSRSAAN